MTVKQCLCKEKIRPGMLVYRHFCGGTIIGEVARVNYRSVRIRKLNDACTALSDEHVTLKFAPSSNGDVHDVPNPAGGSPLSCWCVTDVHELTPEVAREKYFRDKLVGCNPYIAAKIGLTERMSAPSDPTRAEHVKEALVKASVLGLHAEGLDGQLALHGAIDIEKDDRYVSDMINAGKYTSTLHRELGMVRGDVERARRRAHREACDADVKRLKDLLRHDLEIEHGIRRRVAVATRPNLTLLTVPVEKATLLWNKALYHGHANGLHEVAYWYEELCDLVK